MVKNKTVNVHFELVEYLSYFGPVLVRFLLIWSFEMTHSIIPYMLFIKVVLPLLDYIVPLDTRNRPPEEQDQLEKDWRYLLPLYTYIALQVYFNFWLLNVLYYDFPLLSIYQKFLFILIMGTGSGVNLVVGHELAHRKEKIHQVFGILMYFRFLNTNFGIQHNQGHHKWVATPLDPSSARQGQTVYQFARHSMYYSLLQGWQIENERLLKKSPKMAQISLILNNQVFQLKMLELLYLGAIYFFYGMAVTLLWIVLALLLQFALETINYIEHYGLRRKEISPGKYERTTIMHSWNAAQRITNALQFKLQRHSDHHENAYKPYQGLCSYEESPQLPHGYGLAINIALQPKLWFEMMDPLVNAYQNEHRQPNPEELETCNKIALKLMKKNAIQMAVISLIGLIL